MRLRKWTSAIAALLMSGGVAFAVATKLSDLSASAAVAGTDLFYVVQSAGSGGVKATAAKVATYVFSLFSQDCTANSTGTITCTKTNNVAFGALATTTPGTGVATAAAANLSANGGLTTTIASGAKALATGAIGSAACTSAQTDTATNTATTDTIIATFNGDPTAVTGYVPLTTGMLTIIAYPTANTVNFKVCNNTNASITPGAITLNWRVVR